MERVLWAFSALALVSSVFVFSLCGVQLLKLEPEATWSPGVSIADRFNEARDRGETRHPEETRTSALVGAAEAFASHLNPPRQQAEKPSLAVVTSSSGQTAHMPSVEPVRLTPKFRLAGTSYYRLRPEESMALVWEPGTGYRWIKQGARLGHFTVAEIKPGRIGYLDGQVQGEMQVDTMVSADLGHADVVASASGQTSISPVRSSILPQRATKTDGLSSTNREAQPMAQ